MSESLDGAPLVQGVNTFKGSPIQLLSRVLDGNLAELAGGPLFLLLQKYYQEVSIDESSSLILTVLMNLVWTHL